MGLIETRLLIDLTIRKHSPENHGVNFEIIGDIADEETIAQGAGIREIARLRRLYGRGRWRKKKGKALIRLEDGEVLQAELHWYEAHGIGRREFKIKQFLDKV